MLLSHGGSPSLGPINVYTDSQGTHMAFLVISSVDGGQSLTVAK